MSEEKNFVINVNGENATVILHTSSPSFDLGKKEVESEDLKEGYNGIAAFSTQGPSRGR